MNSIIRKMIVVCSIMVTLAFTCVADVSAQWRWRRNRCCCCYATNYSTGVYSSGAYYGYTTTQPTYYASGTVVGPGCGAAYTGQIQTYDQRTNADAAWSTNNRDARNNTAAGVETRTQVNPPTYDATTTGDGNRDVNDAPRPRSAETRDRVPPADEPPSDSDAPESSNDTR